MWSCFDRCGTFSLVSETGDGRQPRMSLIKIIKVKL